eukprot:scaffold1311_cov256-Pinguiococcus_pyrenoidosus.AAC.6
MGPLHGGKASFALRRDRDGDVGHREGRAGIVQHGIQPLREDRGVHRGHYARPPHVVVFRMRTRVLNALLVHSKNCLILG